MCSHYQAEKTRKRLEKMGVFLPPDWELPPGGVHIYPGLKAPFIRKPRERSSGDEAVPAVEVVEGVFGLLPFWAKDEKLARSTYNARTETVAAKPSFRDA